MTQVVSLELVATDAGLNRNGSCSPDGIKAMVSVLDVVGEGSLERADTESQVFFTHSVRPCIHTRVPFCGHDGWFVEVAQGVHSRNQRVVAPFEKHLLSSTVLGGERHGFLTMPVGVQNNLAVVLDSDDTADGNQVFDELQMGDFVASVEDVGQDILAVSVDHHKKTAARVGSFIGLDVDDRDLRDGFSALVLGGVLPFWRHLKNTAELAGATEALALATTTSTLVVRSSGIACRHDLYDVDGASERTSSLDEDNRRQEH